MLRITKDMTETEYEVALDRELEEERLRYGDERRICEKGYDFKPNKIRIMRPSFHLAKTIQSVLDENPLTFSFS